MTTATISDYLDATEDADFYIDTTQDGEHQADCILTGPATFAVVDEQSGSVAYLWSAELAQAVTAALRLAATDPRDRPDWVGPLMAQFRSAVDAMRAPVSA